MEASELKPIVESMIFVSEEPVTENTLLMALSESGVDRDMLRSCIGSIQQDWNESLERGVQLVNVAGGFQFRTKEKFANWIKSLNVPKPVRLSSPALETLAIVAYKQPIIRSEIEKIRGVDSGGVLKTLLERRLVRIVGRQDEPGQPLLYGTTKEFLETFNLSALKELPTLRDVEELMRERKQAQTIKENQNQLTTDDVENFDDEEPTEVIADVSDEETLEEDVDTVEGIKRYPLDANEEDEKRDMQALDDLEANLKDLRRLEKTIFPKPVEGLEGIDLNSLTGDSDITNLTVDLTQQASEEVQSLGGENGEGQQNEVYEERRTDADLTQEIYGGDESSEASAAGEDPTSEDDSGMH